LNQKRKIKKKPTFDLVWEINLAKNSPAFLKATPFESITIPQKLLVYQNTQIQIWDNREKIAEWFPPQGTYIIETCFAAKGEFIYTVLNTNLIYILNTKLKHINSVRALNDNSNITAFASNPQITNQIAIGTEKGQVWILDFLNK